jgi:ATP-dependent DNA helicase RecG
MFIRELTESVDTLRGIGPRQRGTLAGAGLRTVADLLLDFPRDYEDRSTVVDLSAALGLARATCVVRVIAHDTVGWGRRRTLKVYVEDESARAALVCYNRNYLERVLRPGATFLVSGTFRYRYGEIQTSSFEVEPYARGRSERIVPIYSLSEGLPQATVRKATWRALKATAELLEEELPEDLRRRYGFPAHREAVRQIHFPASSDSLASARSYLVYWEFFYLQVAIQRRYLKRRLKRESPRQSLGLELRDRLIARLPFSLTTDQNKVLEEIERDLRSEVPMARLLQGDVGCGKTLVALLAALLVIGAGEQTALMAPTELLARQHGEAAAKLLEPLGLTVALLTGTVAGERRESLLEAIEAGEANLIVGTHALFSESVRYRRLGLVVVDEQHRFGVLQRVSLVAKGHAPDVLLMTATPIPRTLALTAFGDLDVSTIRTMPEGRIPVITHLARQGNERKVYDRVRREVGSGRQAYFVYPLIEESDKLELKHAEGMYERLAREVFPEFNVALIHSRLPEMEKEQTMDGFNRGDVQVLVSTSVVEVGVDVADATCMVVEHAERFGLSALHQLRGRVGRGRQQSFAFLIYGDNLTEDGIARLRTMMETSDGFRIAEEDLRIRGPGELLGIRQSGYMRLRVADLVRDAGILARARSDVRKLLETDPGLLRPENTPVREVLARAAPFQDENLDGG